MGQHVTKYWLWAILLAGAVAGLSAGLTFIHLSNSQATHLLCSDHLSHQSRRSSHPFLNLYQSNELACEGGHRNFVLGRYEDPVPAGHDLPPVPWSIRPETYQSYPDLPLCDSPEALLESLKLGSRLKLETWDGSDDNGTYFKPYGCNYRWYSTSEACEVASRYSAIFLVGDSLTRMHMQGMLIALTGDLVHGGLSRFSERELYGNCSCDGQFSENLRCRTSSRSLYNISSSHSYGICSLHPEFSLQYFLTRPVLAPICAPDARPRAMLFQGGPHVKVDANRTISEIVTPNMERVNRVSSCLRQRKVATKLVWTGMNSQAPYLDEPFPHQSEENSVIFNRVVSDYVMSAYGMPSLDFVNMTRDAAVSDGFHYLEEVNLLKAMYLLNLLDLWARDLEAQI